MADQDGGERVSGSSGALVWVAVIHYACSCVPLLWHRDALVNGNPGTFFLGATLMMAIVVLLGWMFDAYAPLKNPSCDLSQRKACAVLCFQSWAIAFGAVLALVLWNKPFTLNHLTYWFVIFSVFFAVTLPWFLQVGRHDSTDAASTLQAIPEVTQ